jgi:hypothetical protein
VHVFGDPATARNRVKKNPPRISRTASAVCLQTCYPFLPTIVEDAHPAFGTVDLLQIPEKTL